MTTNAAETILVRDACYRWHRRYIPENAQELIDQLERGETIADVMRRSESWMLEHRMFVRADAADAQRFEADH